MREDPPRPRPFRQFHPLHPLGRSGRAFIRQLTHLCVTRQEPQDLGRHYRVLCQNPPRPRRLGKGCIPLLRRPLPPLRIRGSNSPDVGRLVGRNTHHLPRPRPRFRMLCFCPRIHLPFSLPTLRIEETPAAEFQRGIPRYRVPRQNHQDMGFERDVC